MPAAADFLIPQEYRRFEEFCNAGRRDRYIGLCYGLPGVGKTLSARHYAHWHLVEEHDPFNYHHPIPRELAACRTLRYTPGVTNTPRSVSTDIAEGQMTLRGLGERAGRTPEDPSEVEYHESCELILVDEADRLKMPSLEMLRDLYDRQGFGLVLIGMPGLEKRLARYPQLYSRVGFAHVFRPLSQEEMLFILEHHWVALGRELEPTQCTDQEAVAAIIRITAGNFRLLNRLVAQIRRLIHLNGLQTITREVVEAARKCLVIGTT
jgi:DNA transposition AAA+ family ATPase